MKFLRPYHIPKYLILCLFILIPTVVVSAREVLTDNLCIVGAERTIEGALLAFCEELIIDGVVNGDVFGATVRTTINGEVNGSLYMVGGQLEVYGNVTQDVHYGGAVLRLNPPILTEDEVAVQSSDVLIMRSVKALTLSTSLSQQTVVEEGVINVGYQLIVDGDINSEVSFWGSAFVVNGLIDGNVYAVVGDPDADSSQIETLLLPFNFDLNLRNPGLTVGELSEITGLLSYRGPHEGQIEGTLLLEPNYVPPQAIVPTLDEPGTFTVYFQVFGREFSTLIVIGLIAVFFVSNFLVQPIANLRTRPFASLGVGMLGFLLSFPVVLIIIILSLALLGFLLIIGLRGVVLALAFVLGLINFGGVSIFYFMAIYFARALVGLAIGRFVLRVVFNRHDVDEHRWLSYLALFLGVLLVSIIISLPLIGIIMNAIALFLGLGAILIVVMAQLRRIRETTPTVAPAWYAPSPAIIRERHLHSDLQQANLPSSTDTQSMQFITGSDYLDDDDTLPAPGIQNLPEGFDWDFFNDD